MNKTIEKSSVLLIGCGKMGGALLAQWQRSTEADFTVCDPADLDIHLGISHVTTHEQLEGQMFDYAIVAIKPQLVESVLPQYRPYLKSDAVIVSIAAGCSVARLQSALGDCPVVRIMPNLPAIIGAGVAGLYADNSVPSKDMQFVENLMSFAGTSVWVTSEDGLDRVTAVAGSGPGYIFEFARAYVEAAMELGFSEAQAHDLVLGTIAGTIEMARTSNQPLDELRSNVTSKNGTTEAGLKALNLNDQTPLSKLLRDTIRAAYGRAIELR